MTNCDYHSPLGDLLLTATPRGLSGIWFHGQRYFATPTSVRVSLGGPALDGRSKATINECVSLGGPALDGRSKATIKECVSLGGPALDGRSKDAIILESASRWLDQYFSGLIPDIQVPIDLSAGTPFQQAVWREIAKIPYGHTITYGDIGRAIGRPRGAQAVGQAVGRNPVSIIVPCHRVMGAHGAITGYAAGIDIKEKLLELEGILLQSPMG